MASTPLPLPSPAGSPPYPSHATLPQLNTNIPNKKRTAADGSPAPALKRRKGSQMSTTSFHSTHPLRQTSFPPDEAQGTPLSARSPSVDIDSASLVSGSAVSSAFPSKRKRGRKSKAELARQQTPSVVGGPAGSVAGSRAGRSAAGAKKKGAAGGDDGDEEYEEEDAPVAAGTAATTDRSQAERDEDKRLRAAMTNALDADQFDRFAAWRMAKLGDANVRRLVNATVSQSVPPNVIMATKTVTKHFLANLIASARTVQKEWNQTDKEEQNQPPFPGRVLARGDPEVREEYERQAEMYEFKPLPEEGPNAKWLRDKAVYIRKEEPVGPLRPEHLREALRRYKRTVQNNTVGIHGLWHTQQSTGVERFPVRTGGRRIFK